MCYSCGGANAAATVGGRTVTQKWIYQHPVTNQKTEVNSESEAHTLVTVNGGGAVYRKPN